MVDNILSAATLWNLVWQGSTKADEIELGRKMSELESGDRALVAMAAKLMAGKSYAVSSNSTQTIARYRLLAQRIGASIESESNTEYGTKIFFNPPSYLRP